MKMPDKIANEMFAPCGNNCITCEKHCNSDNPCPGCLISDRGKSKSSLKCKIKLCFDKKNFRYCSRCSEFPCKLIKKHDKNQKKRYDLSTIENCKKLEYMGINKIMAEEREKWLCPECEGIISYQLKKCSECGKELSDNNQINKI